MKLKFETNQNLINESVLKDCQTAIQTIENKTGAGSEFLGWLDLPVSMKTDQLAKQVADSMHQLDDVIVIGIGGSYLGCRAILSSLENQFRPSKPKIHFAGHHLSAGYLKQLLDYLENRSFGIIVISKSGTTTEPAIAFRFLFERLNRQYGTEGVRKRVVVITDEKKGTLRKLANDFGLLSGVVPDDVGGRFSVLSAVGLVPLAVGGIDIQSLLAGAESAMNSVRRVTQFNENPALAYAVYRNSCYTSGKKIELLASYRPELHYVSEWWKQLYGESEGKNNQGIFPASVDLTSDLHSMGQWIQEGERSIFETVIDVEQDAELKMFITKDDGDGLNYLADRNLNEINRIALQATMQAHIDGGVPCATIKLPSVNAYHLGELIYMFEYGCAISAYSQNVNPFDQPGVEAYKSNMFRMLGKPGS
ncbi:MAG: glucose-6-phosphate isomerase [Leptonema sp. (in: Bacteria)]|nr:glucose-6-phosphate isomerase [Leptonema sp. (in: bacteria)]